MKNIEQLNLPWKITKEAKITITVTTSDGAIVLEIGTATEENLAKAELIITACNSHLDLLDACVKARDMLQNMKKDYEGFSAPVTLQILDRAIKKGQLNISRGDGTHEI